MPKEPRIVMACQEPDHKAHWHVTQRKCNFSAFNGYRYSRSDYSQVRCPIDGKTWRSKGAYVDELPDAPPDWSRQ